LWVLSHFFNYETKEMLRNLEVNLNKTTKKSYNNYTRKEKTTTKLRKHVKRKFSIRPCKFMKLKQAEQENGWPAVVRPCHKCGGGKGGGNRQERNEKAHQKEKKALALSGFGEQM